jgi:hypothetical protein
MVNRRGINFFKNTYLSTALLFFCISSGCNTSTAEQPGTAGAFTNAQLLQADNLLHQRLQAVQEADNRYTELLTIGTTTAQQDAESGRIAQAEMALQQSIDSLEKRYAAAKNADLARLLQFFRASLQNRQAASDLRMALSAESEDSVSMQQTVVQLRADLRERDRRIATLEQESRSVNRSQSIAEKNVKETAPGSFAPANGESLADLKQRNKNLLLELNNVQNKYFIIGRNYLLLKQEHERTIKELAALRKPGSGGNQP